MTLRNFTAAPDLVSRKIAGNRKSVQPLTVLLAFTLLAGALLAAVATK